MTLVTEAVRVPLPARGVPATREPAWFASYPAGVPRTIDAGIYPSLHAMLLEACRDFAERPAFECLRARITYAEWEQYSRGFAAFLVEQAGCRPGDRVAIMLPNLLAYPVAFLGALRAGMTAVNVNPLYTPRELKEQLTDSGATVIVILENFAHKLETIIAETQIRHVVVARLGDFAALFKRWAFNLANSYIKHAVPTWHLAKFTMLLDACNHVPSAHYVDAEPGADAVALLQYTGGTTGVSKGAMLSHRNLIANTLQCSAWIGSGVHLPEERVLTPLPLYHIFSSDSEPPGVRAFRRPECADSRSARSTPAHSHHARRPHHRGIRRQHAVQCAGQPAGLCGARFQRLARRLSAAAPRCRRKCRRRWRKITGRDLVEGYGLTEASPVVCINPLDSPKLGTVGLPVPSTEVRSATTWARYSVRARRAKSGYAVRRSCRVTGNGPRKPGVCSPPTAGCAPAISALSIREGFLQLLDRKKDLIIVSGFKVFPNEVEDVTMLHPGVLEAAVIGVPDARTGEAVKLFVVKRDAALTAADLTKFLQARLVNYKRPHIIEFRDSLPKSNIGKILRKELR